MGQEDTEAVRRVSGVGFEASVCTGIQDQTPQMPSSHLVLPQPQAPRAWSVTPAAQLRTGRRCSLQPRRGRVEDAEACAAHTPTAPLPAPHPAIPDPERLSLPDPRPFPRTRGSGLVRAFPSAALSPLTRTRAPSSRSSSPQPQAPGAGSALCGMLRGGAARAGRPPYRLLRHVAPAAAAKNRDVGGGWYPEQRCGGGCGRDSRGCAAPDGSARLSGAVQILPPALSNHTGTLWTKPTANSKQTVWELSKLETPMLSTRVTGNPLETDPSPLMKQK